MSFFLQVDHASIARGFPGKGRSALFRGFDLRAPPMGGRTWRYATGTINMIPPFVGDGESSAEILSRR
jgi:hypothetical protein